MPSVRRALRAYLRAPRAGSLRHRTMLWVLKLALLGAGVPVAVVFLAMGLAIANAQVTVVGGMVIASNVRWVAYQAAVVLPSCALLLALAVWAHALWLRRRPSAGWVAAAAALPAIVAAEVRFRPVYAEPPGLGSTSSSVGAVGSSAWWDGVGYVETFTLWGVELDGSAFALAWALLLVLTFLVVRRPDAPSGGATLVGTAAPRPRALTSGGPSPRAPSAPRAQPRPPPRP